MPDFGLVEMTQHTCSAIYLHVMRGAQSSENRVSILTSPTKRAQFRGFRICDPSVSLCFHDLLCQHMDRVIAVSMDAEQTVNFFDRRLGTVFFPRYMLDPYPQNAVFRVA